MAKNKIAEVKNLRSIQLEKAESAYESGDNAAYEAAIAEVKKYNAEIEGIELLLAEQGRFEDNDAKMAGINAGISRDKENEKELNKREDILASSKYRDAFIYALENKIHFVDGKKRMNEETAILYSALTGTIEEDGGYLVPIDINNRINELKRSFTNLESLVNVENTNAPTGSRVFEKNKAKHVFTDVDESAEIPETTAPKFRQIKYAVKKYGGTITMPNELLNDNAANLAEYIAKWMARTDVNTNNIKIIGKLNTLTAKPLVSMNDLKAVLNVTLDPDVSVNSAILTNQDGFNYLDQLEDATGRPLLQPDLTNRTGYVALGRPVIMVSNAVLPSVSDKAPAYVGWLEEFLTKFSRMGYEIAWTNVGAGTFETWTTKMRALSRFDYQIFDEESVAKMEVGL